MLCFHIKVNIIDTKFYGRSMQTRADYDSRTIHSGNLYQIFTYVKNKDVGNTGNVSGLLLYAKTNETITPDVNYTISGNKTSTNARSKSGFCFSSKPVRFNYHPMLWRRSFC